MAGPKVLIAGLACATALSLGGCAAYVVPAHPNPGNVTLTRAAATSTPFDITGYAEDGDTTKAQLKASTKAMTMVGVDGVNLTPDGDGITAPDDTVLGLLHDAHAEGDTAQLLVSNYSDAIGDFDDSLAEKMFGDPAKMTDVVTAITNEVTTDGWDGITIDLESLNGWGAEGHTRDDNAGLDAFVTQLAAAIGAERISICLTATEGSYADLGYDLATIGSHVGHVVLMAYDQHGPTWSKAGAVGGYPWVKASLNQLLKGVAASRIQLGIAGYGYSWAHGKQQKTGDQYSDKQARAYVKKHHATAHWSSTQKEWHATLANGTVIWWSDAKSYKDRKALAKSKQLGGIAVWSLGQSDPLR